MTQFTVSGEPGCYVVRVGSTVVVSHMAAGAGIGRGSIIAIMAGIAIDRGVGAGEGPVIVMYWECSRLPVGICSMASLAIRPGTYGGVRRIC